MKRQYYVYILTSSYNGTIYIGVTNNLVRRVKEHKEEKYDSFTKKYRVNRLVYYEVTESIITAISREKELKGFVRRDKIKLIEKNNSQWRDLVYLL